MGLNIGAPERIINKSENNPPCILTLINNYNFSSDFLSSRSEFENNKSDSHLLKFTFFAAHYFFPETVLFCDFPRIDLSIVVKYITCAITLPFLKTNSTTLPVAYPITKQGSVKSNITEMAEHEHEHEYGLRRDRGLEPDPNDADLERMLRAAAHMDRNGMGAETPSTLIPTLSGRVSVWAERIENIIKTRGFRDLDNPAAYDAFVPAILAKLTPELARDAPLQSLQVLLDYLKNVDKIRWDLNQCFAEGRKLENLPAKLFVS